MPTTICDAFGHMLLLTLMRVLLDIYAYAMSTGESLFML